MKRKTFLNHLHYYFWLYAVFAVAVVFIWYYLFTVFAKPKSNQRLDISFVGITLDTDRLQNDLYNNISVITTQDIKSVSVEKIVYTDDYNMNLTLFARANGETDLIVIEDSTISEKQISVETYFISLNKEKVISYFGDGVELYEKSGKIYGICLFNGSNNTAFSEYYSGGDKCWAFLTPATKNAAGWNGKGNSDDEAALQTLKYLLAEKNNV